MSTNTVSKIIKQKGRLPETIRQDKIRVDFELLRNLHAKCDGYVQRIHEILTEEEGILIGYSTLTRNIRELNLGQPKSQRCDQRPDMPGAEMQHDTSPYIVKFGTNRAKVVASIIYMRYSKMRYLKFYRSFNRFAMKCFRHPVKKIEKLPHTPKVKFIPKEGDIIKLFLAADPKTDEKYLLIFLLHTLARIDEVLRLKWDDVNKT